MKNWEEQLWRVHGEINRLTYVDDGTQYKRDDFWTNIDSGGGDCEDYAIAKLRALVKLGWPIEKLHLACCYTEPDGVSPMEDRYHAVLLVDAPDGKTYMLDNRLDVPIEESKLDELQYTRDIVQAVGGQPGWKEWLA